MLGAVPPPAPARVLRAGALPLLVAAWLLIGLAAAAQADDRIPTAWMEQAGTAPLLYAPPPPVIPTICVIDTGVTPTPDLDIADRTSLVGDDPNDVTAVPGSPGHGTTVAHFAAGKVNGWGGAGAFPHARITSVRVFATADGGTDWQDYLAALDACQKRSSNLRVITVSIGGPSISPQKEVELDNRIRTIRKTYDVSVVAAAGNGGQRPDAPGRFPASFTVAAASATDELCGFSARGAEVDVAAPGCSVLQAGWNGSIFAVSGTSFATPIVAGSLAALRAYAPELTAEAAEQALLRSARRSASSEVPVVDLSAALRAVGRGDVLSHTPAVHENLRPSSAIVEQAQISYPKPAPLVPSGRRGPADRKRVRRPNVRVRRLSRGRVELRAINRPRGAIFEIRAGRRTSAREASRFVVRRNRSSVRARFLTDAGPSPWVRVAISSRKT